MPTRIWLSKNGIEKIEKGDSGAADRLMGMTVYRENSLPYISIDGELTDPVTTFPRIPSRFVRRVTLVITAHKGTRNDGIYRRGSAVAQAKTTQSAVNLGQGVAAVIVRQDYSVAGRTIPAVVALYRDIRAGKIVPTEDWES